MTAIPISRRSVLRGSAAAAAFLSLRPGAARAAAFPERNFKVVIPTRQGGGADRLARTFDDPWSKLLGRQFEYDFYPGAAGQVGYEIYVNRRERDGYNLLFGNMGPEMIMYALQKPKYKFPDDYIYFCRLDVDDSVLFVRAESPFKRIEDVVAEAKRRTVNVATSRIPHPASIGVLALGSATKASFNLVPYQGGNPTMVAVLNGEADCGVLPGANPIAMGDKVRVLTVFNKENSLAAKTGNAPPVNKVFGTRIPDLYSSRSWAIHAAVLTSHPERFKRLNETARKVFDDPGYRTAYEKTGAPFESIQYGDREVCTKYALAMIDLANEYRSLLSAQK
jgi:tripartite-type tricarboxylate transporter receptor subunit TctC